MKRTAALLAVPVLAGTMTLTACGGSASTTNSPGTSGSAGSSQTTTGTTATSPATSPAAPTSAAGATGCPTESTRAFAKTRFVADVGLAAGTFHRWIYKPYKAGAFQQGAEGRTLALVKAGGVAALDLKLISNAYENVKADPTLCNALGEPLGKLKTTLDGMATQVKKGDFSSVVAAESALTSVLGSAQKQGLVIEETDRQTTTQ